MYLYLPRTDKADTWPALIVYVGAELGEMMMKAGWPATISGD